MEFIQEQLLFYFAIIIVLFTPGWFLMRAIFKKETNFGMIEKFVISFGLSIISVDFLMILMGKSKILLTQKNILITIGLFSLLCYLLKKFSQKTRSRISKILKFNFASLRIFAFRDDIRKKTANSNKHTFLIIIILFFTIFIKTAYLKNTIFPTSTDLGHHMYWSKLISQTGELPIYEKNKIITADNTYQISEPQPIADFIIGEHLIFSAINLISGVNFISYFPSIILFLINIMSLLTMFILTLQLFKNKTTAIFTLFLLGPLWAISSPQAKFVSGGVIGNLLGNLFIPLALYFYFRAFKNPTAKHSSRLLTTALFITVGLFYTHHLSGFIFLFISGFITATFLLLLIFNRFRNSYSIRIKPYAKLIFFPSAIVFLLLTALFLLFVYAPAYLQTSAVDTAVGSPSKSTRAGLSFTQLKYTVGEPRLALGLAGLAFLLFHSLKNNSKIKNSSPHTVGYWLPTVFLFGWSLSTLIMTIKPHWLGINIPSGRIGNYVAFPIIITGALILNYILKNDSYLPKKMKFATYYLLLASLLVFGVYDNLHSFKSKSDFKKANQVFHATAYLNDSHLNNNDIVLKDHNYLTADTWLKLFFMRDYSYPFSRSYFKRYEDKTKQREMCTLWMISEPNSQRGQKCYNETSVNFVIVNPKIDNAQFQNSNNFWKVYANNEVSIYYQP